MQCNIDQRGRRVRRVWAVVMLMLATACAVAAAAGWWAAGWAWLMAAVLGSLAAFAFYEARKGWCAVRAMGFDTPV